MNPEQKFSLLKEFDSFDVRLQQAIIRKYSQTVGGPAEGEDWLQYLKSILRIEAYWKVVGLSD